jgi:cathepsin L
MFTNVVIISAAFSAAAIAADCDAEYGKFLEAFPHKVPSPEKKAIFCKSLEEVSEFNQKNSGWSMGINEFSDWEAEDIAVLFGAGDSNVTRELPPSEPKAQELASSVDWRSRMPPVKKQLACASCWAFAAIAVIDFLAGGSHSEQQLVDCSGGGCDPSPVSGAFRYLFNDGSNTESQYPYTGTQGTCVAKSGGPTIAGYGQYHMYDAEGIMKELQEQVVSLEIDLRGSGLPFMRYESGIYDAECGLGQAHAFAAVGYGSDYWIIRNQWGSDWGQNGHVYFKKGKNLCNIESRNPMTARLRVSEPSGAAVVV